jgi:hypothetical protein
MLASFLTLLLMMDGFVLRHNFTSVGDLNFHLVLHSFVLEVFSTFEMSSFPIPNPGLSGTSEATYLRHECGVAFVTLQLLLYVTSVTAVILVI